MNCDLCGSEKGEIQHYVGGCINNAHKECAEIAEVAIQRYEKWLKFINKIKKGKFKGV